MNIITNRPIDTVNIDNSDDFYSMEGDYSNAKGVKKSKPAKATKDRTQKNNNKATRKSNRQRDRVKNRLDKAKTKVKKGAKPLKENDAKDGKKTFSEKLKALFKRKNPVTGKEEHIATDEMGKEKVVDNKDVETKSGIPFLKQDIKEAINDGATFVSNASGLVAEYTADNVIAVDDDATDNTEYYKKSDIEGNWWTKQSTPIKIAIVGGSLALVGFLGYMIFKTKK
jgi:hypothetical protein